jgi:hypothetical protein
VNLALPLLAISAAGTGGVLLLWRLYGWGPALLSLAVLLVVLRVAVGRLAGAAAE